MSNRKPIYVGIKTGDTKQLREVFRPAAEPTEASHGHLYGACVGPFKTVQGAKATVHYGSGNPHILTVADAERIGKQYAADLKTLPLQKEVVFPI